MNISYDLFSRKGRFLSVFYKFHEASQYSVIGIVEEGKAHYLYRCDYEIEDVRFVQDQTTDDIMITWLAWTDSHRQHSRTYLLSFDESLTVQRVDLLKTISIGREKNILPRAVQYENGLLLGQINLVEGRVSISLHDTETLSMISPAMLLQDSISYDFYDVPEKYAGKFSLMKVGANEVVIMFNDNGGKGCIYACRINDSSVCASGFTHKVLCF